MDPPRSPERAGDFHIDRFEGLAKKLPKIADTVEGERHDSGQSVGSHRGDGDDRPDQAWYRSNDVQEHPHRDDEPLWSDGLCGTQADNERKTYREKSRKDRDLHGLEQSSSSLTYDRKIWREKVSEKTPQILPDVEVALVAFDLRAAENDGEQKDQQGGVEQVEPLIPRRFG